MASAKYHGLIEAANQLTNGVSGTVTMPLDTYDLLKERIADLEKANNDLEATNYRMNNHMSKIGINPDIFEHILGEVDVSTCVNRSAQTLEYCIVFKVDSEKCKSI